MGTIIRWGVVIGTVAAAIAWIGQSLSSSKGVSLFPDLLSLLTLVAIATFGLRRVLHDAMSRTVVAKRATVLGATAGVIITSSMLARGLILWDSPDALFLAVAAVSSFVAIVVVINALAITTWKAPGAGG